MRTESSSQYRFPGAHGAASFLQSSGDRLDAIGTKSCASLMRSVMVSPKSALRITRDRIDCTYMFYCCGLHAPNCNIEFNITDTRIS